MITNKSKYRDSSDNNNNYQTDGCFIEIRESDLKTIQI